MNRTCITFDEAILRLKRGEAVVFPTDTVAGLGISALHAASPAVLYAIKDRPAQKPISWLLPSIDDLFIFGGGISDDAFRLARAFWPGALTLVVHASANVPAAFASADGTIGLRVPNHPVPLALMGKDGIEGPLVATSANMSGESDANTLEDIDARILSQAPWVESPSLKQAQGLACASTVLDCTEETFSLLREGSISLSEIEAVLS